MSNKLNKTLKKETAALSLLDVLRDKEIFKTEVLGGITGFFAISYILVVNPMILADAGMDVHQTVFATIISSVIGCFIMGFYANSPVVITPGMGVNAFFYLHDGVKHGIVISRSVDRFIGIDDCVCINRI